MGKKLYILFMVLISNMSDGDMEREKEKGHGRRWGGERREREGMRETEGRKKEKRKEQHLSIYRNANLFMPYWSRSSSYICIKYD